MSFSVGSLVRTRGREWVVLPGTDDELVMVRPFGGTDAEITGILTALEKVEPSTFAPPNPEHPGDHRSAQLLRDALVLGFRSSAGPFRSVGHLAVTPRPYQLVPLLMALRQDTVRLLIADDVGIGKTIEAALIARELLDQGDITRTCVLCPPHLAEQWQAELAAKFHIDAQLVVASTAGALERRLPVGRTIFDEYPHVVVSIDFIKSDRRRDEFVRACPEFVIVDEAHVCADAGSTRRHQRYQLVRQLSEDSRRHLVLVTATPHSGKEDPFRSLLSLISPAFSDLPDSLVGEENRHHREHLARHLVQRRRSDIRDYLQADTKFPDREETELTYDLSAPYRLFFDEVLAYARASVRTHEPGAHSTRVRWWSALGLLRALASSPAAAAATMRTRATTSDSASAEDADEIGRATVLDLDDIEEAPDVVPGSDTGEGDTALARRLREMARRADELRGDDDAKVVTAARIVRGLLDDGFQVIVFCRFIETAEYVAEEFRRRLGRRVEVEPVTGLLPPAERDARVRALGGHDRRVLVATDCLSEGINLQDHFSAVVHYDLPWNPTRLEQREGRVDRFGQPASTVRAVTYYGADNRIDESVLNVLLRKHRTIRSALGVSIPVPGSTSDVIEAVTEQVLLLEDDPPQERLPGMEKALRPTVEELHIRWEKALANERVSRQIFAQAAIRPDEVAANLQAMQDAIGSGPDVERFVISAVRAYGGVVSRNGSHGGLIRLDVSETPRALRDVLRLADETELRVGFDLPVEDRGTYLGRTHPLVAALAAHTLDEALDPTLESPARRCGVIRTDAVTRRTHLLLCRFRFNLVESARGAPERVMLAEDAGLLAFTGPPSDPDWLVHEDARRLLDASPVGNVGAAQGSGFLREAIDDLGLLRSELDAEARDRAGRLEAAHRQVRDSHTRARRVRYTATPQLPVDVLGVFVLLPG